MLTTKNGLLAANLEGQSAHKDSIFEFFLEAIITRDSCIYDYDSSVRIIDIVQCLPSAAVGRTCEDGGRDRHCKTKTWNVILESGM